MKTILILALLQSAITADPNLVVKMPAPATWNAKIDKDGHYRATFDDPNNEFRCAVTSYVESDPRNAFGSEITSFTVVCTKQTEVLDERKPGASQ